MYAVIDKKSYGNTNIFPCFHRILNPFGTTYSGVRLPLG